MTTSKKWRENYNYVKTDEIIGVFSNGDPRYRYVKVPKTEDEKTRRLAAYLCTSVRMNGNPRQKTVYLASINYKYRREVGHQAPFWKSALAKVESISLTASERQSIEDALSRCIPRQSEEAIARNEAEFQAFMQAMTSKIKGRM